MLDFLFGTKKVEADLSFLAVDMHSHLLPGIDDGAKDITKSMELITALKDLGYRKLICTPHILSDLYPNSRETILPKLELVRAAIASAGLDIEIEAAAEYMVDDEFSRLLAGATRNDLLTLGKDHILVEMSYLAPSPYFEESLFKLQILGLIPVLAHPERYSYYHKNFNTYKRYKELGCKLQVNLGSLSGGYGPDVKKAAEKLFKNNMVDFLGTDMHHNGHLTMLRSLATKKELYDLTSGANLQNKMLA
ncbi:histidinol phosphatase [Segetibacter sp. 3557_3]|uniref:tyrosine-protein phosphatase n=1 Tax=Segetibacter sp. 3557_3 TaxID=2547429 RepID=UPI001058FD7F|nr:CpsB/CapC family capsule biosynthesis tyrosine phosphatase [Segetibacter sp. 3557_3]TDH27375.1 histidinol phosphatase [Segetibacter sp. 3557_3]